MVAFINGLTGTEFYVAESRVDEYLKAGFKEPPVEEPETMPEKPKKPRAPRKKK